MDARDQVKLGALLDMGLAHAGLEVVRPRKNGAAIIGYEPVDGAVLVAKLMAAFGWSVRPREEEPLPVARVFPVRAEPTPGRAGPAAMLRLVRPGVEESPQHEAGHGDEDTGGRHRDVTEGGSRNSRDILGPRGEG